MRKIKIAAGLVTAALALTACGQGSATKQEAGPDGKTVVRYMNFSANDGHEKDLDAIVAAFQTANPDITVQVETIPYADYFTKLQTAVAGGTAADTFELNYENFVTYAKNGSLAELKDVDSAVYKKSLYDAFNDSGKQFGLPESFSNVVLFYNKALFKKAGVAEPTAEWTWKDEQAAAQKLTSKGIWGDYQPVSYNEFYKALAQAGGSFFNADKTAASFDSPEGLAAANWLIGKTGKTMPTEADGAGTPDFDSKLFKSGKLAMWHTGVWMFSAMAEAPFDWDIVVEPGSTTKASAMFVNGLVVSAASKNAAAAQKWITFLSSSETTTKARLATSWELPPIADEAQLSSYLEQKKPANRKAVLDALEATVLPPVIERQQEMQDIVTAELTAAAAGRKPVAKALTDAQTKVNGLLKK
ncbi:sugar ABC transporter substrate-binding protein [Kribbella sp. NBC_01245]|uniref:ABC transporter substrate-binding protein n=1 Tax=Kribbella sp. NBC_01245 TaxID=2903578 RepID=UPI002E2B49FD|nr:sugar ABC transporter substrate-binding protein [Kribbella sp. NBC_01245]